MFEREMEAQQRVAKTALEGQARLQRRSLELFQTATAGYFETVAATARAATELAPGDRLDGEQFDRDLQDHLERIQELQDRLDDQMRTQADRRHERTVELLEEQLEQIERIQRELESGREPSADRNRLERVGGLDSMYRDRLAEADITTLDDLARADAETVANVADVTEKRAEGWIAQAGVEAEAEAEDEAEV